MFLTITKSNILLCIAVIGIIAGIAIFARTTMATTTPIDKNTILIDAGHGGMDGGAVGKQGTLEKEINLEIAQKLEQLFKEGGYNVIMTRTEDKSLHDSDKKTVRAQKNSDLSNRRKLIANSGAAAFVSVHMNTFSDSKQKGAQVFHATSNEESKALAENVRMGLLNSIQDGNKREIKPIPSNIIILKDVKIPSIIVECGFLSNAEEEQKLATEEYQQQLAQAIYEGVCAYMAK